jgi:hypothetical protein
MRGFIDKVRTRPDAIQWMLSDAQAFCNRIHFGAFNGYDLMVVKERMFDAPEDSFLFTPNDTILTCNIIKYT